MLINTVMRGFVRARGLLFALLVLTSAPATAAVGIGNGNPGTGPSIGIGVGGGCQQVKSDIVRNWSSLKALMAPDHTGVKRPRAREFQCVHPQATRNMMRRVVPGLRGSLSCFKSGATVVCCDERVTACATR